MTYNPLTGQLASTNYLSGKRKAIATVKRPADDFTLMLDSFSAQIEAAPDLNPEVLEQWANKMGRYAHMKGRE